MNYEFIPPGIAYILINDCTRSDFFADDEFFTFIDQSGIDDKVIEQSVVQIKCFPK